MDSYIFENVALEEDSYFLFVLNKFISPETFSFLAADLGTTFAKFFTQHKS